MPSVNDASFVHTELDDRKKGWWRLVGKESEKIYVRLHPSAPFDLLLNM